MTSTTQPLSLNQQPGTPAHEWAEQTVGAVDGAAETGRRNINPDGADGMLNTGGIGGTKSNVTTPGNELPGAFPQSNSTTGNAGGGITGTAQSALASAQQTAASAQQQAAPALQSASETAGGVFASAGQAARTYLPTSVIGTLEGAGVLSSSGTGTTAVTATNTSLPSQETTAFTPTRGGVGSLPGNASEADVAKLPEERALESKTGGAVGREGVLGTHAGAGDSTPPAPAAKEAVSQSRPPGGPSSSGTTTASQFLDSSIQPAPSSTEDSKTDLHHIRSPHSGTLHSTDAVSSSVSPDRDAQKAAKAVRDSTSEEAAAGRERQAAADRASKSAIEESAADRESDRNKPLPAPGGNTNALGGVDNDMSYARDQGAREPARTSPNHAYTPPGSTAGLADEPVRDEGEHEHEHDAAGATTGASGDSPNGKASLKQKIKGEVKVLAGKIGKDPKKVEEGKALKEGHPV